MTERMQDRALQCEAFSGNSAIGEGLKTVKLAGWGRTKSMNGDFIIDDEGVPEILRTFAEHGTAIPIDVEHETLPERQPATGSRGAIGWIEKVFAEANKGLFGLVRWSDAGKALIRSDAFRYLSPVFLIRKDDRRVIALHSAAITTLPAIPKMERLAASQSTNTADGTAGPIVDMGDIADLLGVELIHGGAATLPARCHAKLKALLADNAVAIAQSVRSALGLREDADADLVVATVTTLKAQTAGVAAVETELAALKAQIHGQEAEQWVGAYSAKGVVGIGSNDAERKADREMILRMACSNRADCERVLQQRLAFLPPSGVTTPPTGRQTLIALAEREYRGNVGHQKATSLAAFCQNALREKGLPKLTEAEVSGLSIA